VNKAEFSASLLQSLVSHDPSEIIVICWFAAQDTFMIIFIVENRYPASYFMFHAAKMHEIGQNKIFIKK